MISNSKQRFVTIVRPLTKNIMVLVYHSTFLVHFTILAPVRISKFQVPSSHITIVYTIKIFNLNVELYIYIYRCDVSTYLWNLVTIGEGRGVVI